MLAGIIREVAGENNIETARRGIVLKRIIDAERWIEEDFSADEETLIIMKSFIDRETGKFDYIRAYESIKKINKEEMYNNFLNIILVHGLEDLTELIKLERDLIIKGKLENEWKKLMQIGGRKID